jgi:hypothetical protein
VRTHLRNPAARLETVCGRSIAGLLLREELGGGVSCRDCLRLAQTSPASTELERRRLQVDWLDGLGGRRPPMVKR